MNPFSKMMTWARGFGSKIQGATYGSMILDSYNTTPVAKANADWVKTFGSHPWLHATVTRIAEGVAASPWEIYRPQGSNSLFRERSLKTIGTKAAMPASQFPTHPAVRLLERPNTHHTGYQFRCAIIEYLELTGEAFVIIDKDPNGVPQFLWPIPSHWVEALPSTNDPHFIVRLNGKPEKIAREGMMWFKKVNPYDPYGRGLADAQAAADEVVADEYAAKQNVRWFYNGARPDIMMILKGKLRGPGEARRLRENWYTEYGGLWNAYKLAIVEGDVADIKPLGTAPKDMEFSELRRTTRDAIIGAWGMPPNMVGIVEDVNRASADTGEYLFAKWIIYPRLIMLQDTITSDLLSQYHDYPECWMEHVDPVPENRGQRNNEMQAAVSMGCATVDEYRKSIGLPPLPNGMGKVFVLQPGMTASNVPGGINTSGKNQGGIPPSINDIIDQHLNGGNPNA